MLKTGRHLLLLLLTCNLSGAFAQAQPLAFTNLTTENGLSSNHVTGILQDDLGYTWIATHEGLNRYDGHSIKVFKHVRGDTSSITSHDILCLKKDRRGNIWIGTGEGVLHLYNMQTGTFESHKVPVNVQVPVATINDLLIGGDGKIWLALERGLGCFDTKTKSFRTWRPSSFNSQLVFKKHDVLYSLVADPHRPDILWLGSRYGLVRFDKAAETFEPVYPEEGSPIYTKGIFDMKTNSRGNIWLTASKDAIIRFDPVNYTWKSFQDKAGFSLSPRAILPINDDEFWVASFNDGLKHLDAKTGKFTKVNAEQSQNFSILPGSAESLYFDDNGRLWVGTANGVSHTDPSKLKFRHYEYGAAPGNNAEKFTFPTGAIFLEDKNLLFTSTIRGEKAYFFDAENGSILKTVNRLPEGVKAGKWFCNDAVMDGLGQIWVATNKGLFRASFDDDRLVLPDWKGKNLFTKSYCRRLARDMEGKLWATTYPYGLLQIDVHKKVIKHIDLSQNADNGFPKPEALNGIAVDKKNRLWYGGEPYVAMYDPANGELKKYSANKGCTDCLSYSWIHCLAVAPDGKTWVGYKYGGLDRIDPEMPAGQQITHFSTADGLPSNKVFKMVFDQSGDLWLATGNGLSRLETDRLVFKNFYEKDGLKNNDLNRNWLTSLHLLANGEIALGGPGYLTRFQPADFKENGLAQRLVFNELKVFDEEKRFAKNLNFLKEISLDHTENFFTFQFADLNYNASETPRFRYILEGYDKEWRTTNEGSAPYTGVGGGRYFFKVQTADSNGNWNEKKGLSIRLNIVPPFWQTGWFLALASALLLAAGIFFYQYRVKQIRKKAALKAAYNLRIMEAEMKALRSQMNPHFLFNSLNSIKHYIVSKDPRSASDYLTKFAQLIRLILANSKKQAIPLGKELKALDLYLQLEQMRFPQKFEYEIGIGDGVKKDHIPVPPLILQPYVENAIWHGLMHKKGKGKISIKASKQNGHLQVEILDDGVGRKRSKAIQANRPRMRKSMGLQLAADRLRMNSLTRGFPAKVEI
ncbi:MAG TPA: hypothetical protein ENJ95_11165, partial [Bacteroidetes bacterium]|nr:hypothetical protein [Bacteroidota bacterium]